MDPVGPPPPPPLSAAAAARLYNCVAGMSDSAWLDPDLGSTLVRAQGLLCALHPGCSSVQDYLERLSSGSGGASSSGPCTRVWTAGTIAYRAATTRGTTTQCTPPMQAAAATAATAAAGGPRAAAHATGKLAASRVAVAGPAGDGQQGGSSAETPAPVLPAADAALAAGVVACALARLQLVLEAWLWCKRHGARVDSMGSERAAALRLIRWLGQLAQQPALRALICHHLLLPAVPAEPGGELPQPSYQAAGAAQLPREVAAVAGMLRQQRAVLVPHLERALPLRPAGSPPGAGEPLLPPPPAGADYRQEPLLFWQMATLLELDPGLVEELATLHTLLLYSVPFKEHYGRLLLTFYPSLGVLGKQHAVTQAMDRLTVQVFHLEETTLALTQDDNLLGVLLGTLLQVLRLGLDDATGHLNGDSPELSGRLYLRTAADLHMCLAHPAVVLQLLGGPQAPLFSTHYLEVFRLLQGACPVRRKLGDHVAYESTAWMNVVQAEAHIMHMLKQGALHTLMQAAEEGTIQPADAAAALAFGLQHCLEAVEAAAGPLQALGAQDVKDDELSEPFWKDVLAGQQEMSAHIPLERLSAAFLAGLLHLAHVSSAPQPFMAAAANGLGTCPALPEEARQLAARRWQMCGLAAQRIQRGLWVRNGQELLRLEAFYRSPYWPLHLYIIDNGATELLRAGTLSGAGAPTMCDGLRMLVMVLRERSIWHPTYSPLPLRRSVLHALAAGARSHSEVVDELPYELAHGQHLDQALADLADYLPPTTAAKGQYVLRREAWREFDPFYPHYTRRDLQTALHNAQESRAWRPEWQVQQDLSPPPAAMVGLQRMQHLMLRLARATLALACGGTSAEGSNSAEGGGLGLAEDCALAAINLLALGLHSKAAHLAAMDHIPAGPQAQQAALPEEWSTPAGFLSSVEDYLAGGPPERPGIIYLLRVLVGSELWVGSVRREASWELKACAAAVATQAEQLLHAARQRVPAQQQAETAPPASASTSASERTAAGQAAPHAAAASEQAVQQEAAQQGRQRREHGRLRQQQVLAGMRAQQARAAAALLQASSESAEEEVGGEQQAEGAALAASASASAMDIEAASSQPAAGGSIQQQQALPSHHPAAWERGGGGAQCVLCQSGSEAGPLGLVAQLQVTQLPLLACADPAAPLTHTHPGLPGAAIGGLPAAADAAGSAAGLAAPAPTTFPADGAGPRLSVFDQQPSLHMLSCGHMLHSSCLENYRSSWRQHIRAGQFVEGFRLLQPVDSSGEFLCPICRRLGNCLLPAAPPPAELAARAQEAPLQPPTLQGALQRLRQLVRDDASWAAAPATANPQLVQLWQQAHGSTGGDPAAPQEGSLQLLPVFGPLAAGVMSLSEFAGSLCSSWMLQQQQALEWLQARGSAGQAPLWGVPVAPAGPQPAAAAPPPAGGPPALFVDIALQLLHQAATPGEVTQALNAAVAMRAAEEEQGPEGEGAESELDEEDEGEEAEEGEAAGEGDMAAIFQQLRQAMPAAGAAAEEGQVASEQVGAAGEAGSAAQQHRQRLHVQAGTPSHMMWSLLSSGIVQWEVAHRDPACLPPDEVDAAHWRALQAAAQLALAGAAAPSSSRPGAADAALLALQQLVDGSPQQASSLLGSPIDLSAALLPTMLQLQVAPRVPVSPLAQDPFALALQLLASLLSCPRQQAGGSLTCSSHLQPAALLESLLAALYPQAVAQAVAFATAASGTAAEAAEAMLASQPLAHAIEAAASSQLLPWLQRAALLMELLSGRPAPRVPAAAGAGTVAAAAVGALLQQLHLPPLQSALQFAAAAAWQPSGGEACAAEPVGVQLSIYAGQRRWTVSAALLPSAAKLLQLPPSYQGWYLSLGTQRCSVCGNLPSEPALCLRCGAIVCCGGRRCLGATRQGMCYTHSQACGGGTCCFLLTKMTRLLLIRKHRATFLSSPYVDSHGEEDLRLQRGKPLVVHAERMRRLLQLWRSAAFDFDTQVLHAANMHRSEYASAY